MIDLDSANLNKIENNKIIFEKKLGFLSNKILIDEIELNKEYIVLN
jgi:hypothetical protein